MADMSEFTSVFRARVNLNDKRKSNKRNRQALSCLACRTRKLKCDRQHPCGACSKRGEGTACVFDASSTARPSIGNGITKSSTGPADAKKSEAQARLQKLEELVQQLIQSGAFPDTGDAPRNPEAISTSSDTSGQGDGGDSPQLTPSSSNTPNSPPVLMSYNENSGAYVGATHWAALLDRIQGLKESLGMPSDQAPPMINSLGLEDGYSGTEDSDLILGSVSGLTGLEDAVAGLPSRMVCDRLIATYYSSRFTGTLFIHTHKFRREYERFWENPSSQTLIWVSVLYSILCLGAIMATRCGKYLGVQYSEIDPPKLMKKSRQCLLAGRHTKRQPYIIEALLCYMYCKHQLQDADDSLWALSCYITRFAQRLGYHRDPKHLGTKFTPFESEMRRRNWFWVTTFDLVFSFQYGMPSLIHDDQCDTEAPRNITDGEFDEDTAVLPQPRPDNEYSEMLFFHNKMKMTMVFRKVIRVVLAVKMPDYEEILALDKELDEVYSSIPHILRFKDKVKDASFADASYLILHRMVLQLTYHKCRCVLHRSYLTFERDNPKYAYSRDICRESALRLLEVQADAHEESQPGGRLWDERWITAALTLHDFLLASMIMCLDLSELRKDGSNSGNSTALSKRSLNALQTSYKIWSANKNMSREALHASNILGGMLKYISERERTRDRERELAETARVGRRALGNAFMREWTPASNLSSGPSLRSPGSGSDKSGEGGGQGRLTSIASANAGSDGSTFQLLGFDASGDGSFDLDRDSTRQILNQNNGITQNPSQTTVVASESGSSNLSMPSTALPPCFAINQGQSCRGSVAEPAETSPAELNPVHDAELNDFTMANDFEGIDFDSFMGGGATIDWGMVDRYLFDQSKTIEMMSAPDLGLGGADETMSGGGSNGRPETASSETSGQDGFAYFC